MAKNSSGTKTKGPAKGGLNEVEARNGKAPAGVAVAPGPSDASRLADARFWQIAMLLIVAGIVLRQWALGYFPFSPDEAEHAWFAEGFSTYHYDPIYHGPLLYHLIALMFTLLGKTDYTARLAPSLLGIGMLGVVVGPARRWLGSNGTLWTLALLSLSPVIVSYHRRLIHESLFLLLTLGAVLCFLRALETSSRTNAGRNARLGVAALTTLLVTTKANSAFIGKLAPLRPPRTSLRTK